MRLFQVLALALIGLAMPAWAALNLASIPRCGLNCLVGDTISKSECRTFSNITCLCNNQQVTEELGACVLNNCPILDALYMQKFSDETCERPKVDRSGIARVVPPVFGALAVLLFSLRIVARCGYGKRGWGADDWAIVPPVVATVVLVVLCGFLAQGGLGLDVWYIAPEQITYLLRIFFWGEVLYVFIIPMTKISVLIFYLQMFPERSFKRATWALIILNVMHLVAFVCTTIFQCTPIAGAWDYQGTLKAQCRSLNKQVWAAAMTGIALDIAMLILPMPGLWKLNMTLRKKLQVMLMFGLGAFVTIVSAIRLPYIVAFATTHNPTQDFVLVGILSIVEISVGIICACLPALRSLLAVALPHAFATTQKSKSGKTSNYTGATPSHHQSSNIRVKSEFSVQSRSRVEEEDASIELIMQRPDSAASEKVLMPVDDHVAARRSSDFDMDIEAAGPTKPEFSCGGYGVHGGYHDGRRSPTYSNP